MTRSVQHRSHPGVGAMMLHAFTACDIKRRQRWVSEAWVMRKVPTGCVRGSDSGKHPASEWSKRVRDSYRATPSLGAKRAKRVPQSEPAQTEVNLLPPGATRDRRPCAGYPDTTQGGNFHPLQAIRHKQPTRGPEGPRLGAGRAPGPGAGGATRCAWRRSKLTECGADCAVGSG